MKKVPSLTLFTKGNYKVTPPEKQYTRITNHCSFQSELAKQKNPFPQQSFLLTKNPFKQRGQEQIVFQNLTPHAVHNKPQRNDCKEIDRKDELNDVFIHRKVYTNYLQEFRCKSVNCVLRNVTGFLANRQNESIECCQCLCEIRKQTTGPTTNQQRLQNIKQDKLLNRDSECDLNAVPVSHSFGDCQTQTEAYSQQLKREISASNSNFTFNDSCQRKNTNSQSLRQSQRTESQLPQTLIQPSNQSINNYSNDSSTARLQILSKSKSPQQIIKTSHLFRNQELDFKISQLYSKLFTVYQKIDKQNQQAYNQLNEKDLLESLLQFHEQSRKNTIVNLQKIDNFLGQIQPIKLIAQNKINHQKKQQEKKQLQVQPSQQSIQIELKQNCKYERIEIDSHLNSKSVRLAKNSLDCVSIFKHKKKKIFK